MKIIHLQHDARLGYLSSKDLRPIPADLSPGHHCSSLVSLRRHAVLKPDLTIKKLHAARRVTEIHDGGSCCFYGVQSDSPLSPLLLWDAAHFLKVGQTITLIEDVPMESYLDREYFTDALKVIDRSPTSVTYEKVSRLMAESDSGPDLDGWTFGIPVGPGDATILNAVVKRILEIDIPAKEILLCGTPGSNFAYFDKVRIVGEDIPAPPVQICKKKNRIAQEARYSNLAILHDRVFLPRHFGEMVRRFGPAYPLMTLQSMFFDNTLSMHPRRYSDCCIARGEIARGLQGLHRANGQATAIAYSIFPEVERTGLPYANPLRYTKDFYYPTGSLYLCRKDVWNACPLDDSLCWAEYEDVEHGLRASRAGIPSRINPYGITQSISSRALLGGNSEVETLRGGTTTTGPFNLLPLTKKPLLRVTAQEALEKLRKFESKYASSSAALITPTGMCNLSPCAWVDMIDRVIRQCVFSNTLEAVREFILDFERMVLFDQLVEDRKQNLTRLFLYNPVYAKQTLITHSYEIHNMLRQRVFQTWFARQPKEYFHPDWLALPGILISSICLYLGRNKIFYFESFTATVKAIYNSTPFRSCLKESK